MNLHTLSSRCLIAVIFIALVSACGPASVCDRLPAVQNVVTERRGRCAVTLTLGTVDRCDAEVSSGRCSTSDERGIGRVYDCYQRLPPCTVGAEQAWLAQLNACGAGTGISATCRF